MQPIAFSHAGSCGSAGASPYRIARGFLRLGRSLALPDRTWVQRLGGGLVLPDRTRDQIDLGAQSYVGQSQSKASLHNPNPASPIQNLTSFSVVSVISVLFSPAESGSTLDRQDACPTTLLAQFLRFFRLAGLLQGQDQAVEGDAE